MAKPIHSRKREKKAVLNQLNKLIEKYGSDFVRLTIAKHFTQLREERIAYESILDKEEELRKLKERMKK